MKNKKLAEEVGFVRPDALREELTSVKVIGSVETEKMPKVDVIKVVNLKEKKKLSVPLTLHNIMADSLKVFTDYLLKNGIDQAKGEELIRSSQKIGDLEKLLVYSYCYPRKIGDYELPSIIVNYRKTRGIDLKGLLTKNPEEACILVEAYRSLQYGRFMRHLMHAFIEKPNTISSVAGEGEDKCPICGKPVYYIGSHDKKMDPNDETLAFMSSESSVCMCKDCLLQLAYSAELISKIEGNDFLTNWKPSPKPDFTSDTASNP